MNTVSGSALQTLLGSGAARIFPLAWAGWQTLVPALLHTLWIGAAVAVALGAFLAATPPARARLRYGAALAALGVVLVGGVAAWTIQDGLGARNEIQGAAGASVASFSGSRTAAVFAPTSSFFSPSSSSPSSSSPLPSAAQYGIARQSLSPSPGDHAFAVGAGNGTLDTSTRLAPVGAGRGAAWRAWAGMAWLAGALFMLGRTALRASGTSRWQAGARADAALQRVADDLGRALRVAGRVTVILTERVAVPAVLGIVRPTILWPLAWATGLDEGQVRAILAHELAHVARRDYLVNLVQMFVEALLFFNPAVWWIGRQVRQERESCCDALAASVLGGGAALAHTLADAADGFEVTTLPKRPFASAESIAATVAKPSAIPSDPALAFTGPAPRGGLLDRVRRLLEPGYRPPAHVPFRTLTLALVVSCGVLAVLKEGGDRLALASLPDAEHSAQTAIASAVGVVGESVANHSATLNASAVAQEGMTIAQADKPKTASPNEPVQSDSASVTVAPAALAPAAGPESASAPAPASATAAEKETAPAPSLLSPEDARAVKILLADAKARLDAHELAKARKLWQLVLEKDALNPVARTYLEETAGDYDRQQADMVKQQSASKLADLKTGISPVSLAPRSVPDKTLPEGFVGRTPEAPASTPMSAQSDTERKPPAIATRRAMAGPLSEATPSEESPKERRPATRLAKGDLKVQVFDVLPAQALAKSPSQSADFFESTKEVIETLLYAEEGKTKAAEAGRRLWADPATFQITISDYPDRLRQVAEYLRGLRQIQQPNRQEVITIKHQPSDVMATNLQQILGATAGANAAGGAAAAAPGMQRTCTLSDPANPVTFRGIEVRLRRINATPGGNGNGNVGGNRANAVNNASCDLTVRTNTQSTNITLQEFESQFVEDYEIFAQDIRLGGGRAGGSVTLVIRYIPPVGTGSTTTGNLTAPGQAVTGP